MNYHNHEQRLVDFEVLLPYFQEQYSKDFHPGNPIQFDDMAAQTMNENYWTLREKIDSFMPSESRINMPKIAAGVQIIILLNQPFDPPAYFDDEATKEGIARVNSEFAWSFCLDILFSNIIKSQSATDYKDKIRAFYNTPKLISLQEYHLIWCQKLTATLGKKKQKIKRIARSVLPLIPVLANF
jgi:hypothetical protein